MSKVKLSDICEIMAGGTPSRTCKEYWENGVVPWVKISDIKTKYVNFTEEKVTEKAITNSSAKLFKKGTVLFTIFATLGEVAILNIDSATNQAIAGIDIKDKKIIDLDYLYYFLKSIKNDIVSKGRGVAQNNINLSILRNIEIEVIGVVKQKKIAEILDNASNLIYLRKKQIEKLDLLIKGKFIDMFGDPAANPYNWIGMEFGNAINTLTDYHANGSYEILAENVELLDKQDYALMVRTTDLESNNFIEGVKYITKSAYEFLGKSKVYGGEIIINKIGSAGKVYYMPTLHRPVSLAMNQFMLRFNELANSVYVFYYLKSKYLEQCISERVRGAVTKTITKDAVRDLPFLCPPIELQNQFADFVQQVENQKVKLQQGLEKFELQYKALMQQYFG